MSSFGAFPIIQHVSITSLVPQGGSELKKLQLQKCYNANAKVQIVTMKSNIKPDFQ